MGVSNSSVHNDVWSSDDGANWTKETSAGWAPRHTHASFIYDGKIWIMGGCNASGGCYNDVWCFKGETAINNVSEMPKEVTLFQNTVHGNVNLNFYVSIAGRVTVGIYTITGRLVRRLVDKEMARGSHNLIYQV